jgi:hypothetical protein
MGSGSYSLQDRTVRAYSSGYFTKTSDEIFTSKSINNLMNPYRVMLRESRDSEEHPESLAIVIALDETGSMGSIPYNLVKDGLPHIMDNIFQKGIKHPQLLFLGIGDHECDNSPLQVGQFESNDELLDKWLTNLYLEGRGGGNGGESYLLAWYFAGYRTSIDCFEKRKQKGFLFTIGDEPTLSSISSKQLQNLLGEGEYSNFSAVQLLDKARELYNVFHVHMKCTCSGQSALTINGWKELLGDNLLIANYVQDVPILIANTISLNNQNVIVESRTTPSSKIEILL